MNWQAEPKRFVIVDPGLKDFAGHYYETDSAIAKAASAEGFRCVILAHRGLLVDSIPEAEIKAIYSVGIWTVISGPFHQWPSNLRKASQKLFEETMSHFRIQPPRPNDIIYIPNIVQGQLLAVAMLAEFLQTKGARLVLMFRYSSKHVISSVTTRVFKRLEEASCHSNISLVTDSQRLADELSRFTPLPFQVVPVVLDVDESSSALSTTVEAPKHFHILCLGNPRVEKGFCKFLEAIEILESQPLARRMKITVQVHDASGRARRSLRRFRRLPHPIVTFVDEPLANAAYHKLIKSADLVVLPYYRSDYHARTSGIFLEAVLSGKPVLVTRGTWMEDQLREYGNGLLIDDHDPIAIANGIKSMVRYRELFEDRARKAQFYWRKIHNPSKFVRMLTDPTLILASNRRKIALVIASSVNALENVSTNFNRKNLILKLEERGLAVHCLTLEAEFQPRPIAERSTAEGVDVSGWPSNCWIVMVGRMRANMRKWIGITHMTSYERFVAQVESADQVLLHESVKAKLGKLISEIRSSDDFQMFG